MNKDEASFRMPTVRGSERQANKKMFAHWLPICNLNKSLRKPHWDSGEPAYNKKLCWLAVNTSRIRRLISVSGFDAEMPR